MIKCEFFCYAGYAKIGWLYLIIQKKGLLQKASFTQAQKRKICVHSDSVLSSHAASFTVLHGFPSFFLKQGELVVRQHFFEFLILFFCQLHH